jgi:hypothetical protein
MTMPQTDTIYIGYSTLETWLRALRGIPPEGLGKRPIQSLSINETEAGSHGIYYRIYVHLVSFVAGNQVHYVRIKFGTTQHVANDDLGIDNEAIRQRAVAGSKLVDAWLRAQGLYVVEAIVATPRDLRFLEGWAEFLQLDGSTGQFIAPPTEPAEAQP